MEADLEAVRQKMLERLKQLEGTGKQ